MFYWNPATEYQTWQPVGGWNAMYSERDKIQATALYVHLQNHYSSQVASTLVQMILSKQLYHGLRYSEEQEKAIKKALSLTH